MADDTVEDRRLCHGCVGEVFLRSQIRGAGRDGVCFYCDGAGKTVSIGELADRVEFALDQHFYRTATEPSGLEYAMIKEGDLDWERAGEPLKDVIQNYAEVEPNIAEDVQRALQARHFDFELAKMGEEEPFRKDAYYAESGVDDAESQASWLKFERSLKTEARYFSRTAEWALQSIFEGITEHRTRHGRPIVVEAGPGLPIAAVFRARVFQSDEKLQQALKRPDREIGPPPSKTAPAGRMNPHGISVFYGATDSTIALAEVRPPVASRVVIGRFEFIKPIRLLDVEALRVLNVEGSIFDGTYLARLEKAKFLRWLSWRITMPVMPDDEPFDYLPTQAIADFLATNANPLLHGILYPSAQGGEGKSNIVLFHKAARVQPLDIPEGTEISASLYDETDSGPEINYWVSEEVPPAAPPSGTEPPDVPFSSERLDQPVDDDSREFVLRLDVSTLEVHHVTGITFRTAGRRVLRHRFEKREWKF
jgi:hypothetical protein